MADRPKPVVRAEFVLDANGAPVVHVEGGVEHFEIKLSVEGAPEETHAVTYRLHETYYDPLREVRNRVDGFAQRITSYGDFPVEALIRGRQGTQLIQAPLSRALRQSHGADAPDLIRRAIATLAEK